ncbi:MAG: hypothetical protein RMH81_07610 [Thermomicrobium sp.]|nr:hypothetical protein [Thermomicrobium sp.]
MTSTIIDKRTLRIKVPLTNVSLIVGDPDRPVPDDDRTIVVRPTSRIARPFLPGLCPSSGSPVSDGASLLGLGTVTGERASDLDSEIRALDSHCPLSQGHVASWNRSGCIV